MKVAMFENVLPALLLVVVVVAGTTDAFTPGHAITSTTISATRSLSSSSSSPSARLSSDLKSTATDVESIKASVKKLKQVLSKEYISFFNPMERSYYAESVSFEDPMTALSGVDAYQKNVDMLASRTLMGKLLFDDAGINLHSVSGGEVFDTGNISNIITRWTLRVTAKVIPWKPTARFSGISVYEVSTGGPEGVVVNHQTDYWDSINIQEGGKYDKVDKGIAIQDFLDQLKPEAGNAAAAGRELPYQLLRRGNGYEVRLYPSCTVAKIPYDRRDEGFDQLAGLTQGMTPLAPAIMNVPDDDSTTKTMAWPLAYAAPGEDSPPAINSAVAERVKKPLWSGCDVLTLPGRVVAVGSFSDASVAPVVRRADKELRKSLTRDGLTIPKSSENSVNFAQYDAVFSLGKRRGEVWIELEDGGHPW